MQAVKMRTRLALGLYCHVHKKVSMTKKLHAHTLQTILRQKRDVSNSENIVLVLSNCNAYS